TSSEASAGGAPSSESRASAGARRTRDMRDVMSLAPVELDIKGKVALALAVVDRPRPVDAVVERAPVPQRPGVAIAQRRHPLSAETVLPGLPQRDPELLREGVVVALPVGGAQVGTERPAGVAGRVEVRRVVTAAAANVDLAAQLEPQPRHRQHRVVAVHRQRLAPVAVVVAPLAEFAAKAGTLVARPLQAKGGGVGEDAGGPRLQRCISVVVAGFRAGTPVVVEAPAGGGPVRGRIVGKWTGAAIVAACGLDLPFQPVMAEMQANAVAQVAHARRGVVELGPLLRAEGANPPAIAQQRRADGKRVPAVAAAQRRCSRGTISVAAAPVERCLD